VKKPEVSLSLACDKPDQSLSSQEGLVGLVWFPVLGPVCGLPNSTIVASCVSTTLYRAVQNSGVGVFFYRVWLRTRNFCNYCQRNL
jgi:hypothetical protein